MRPLVVGQAPAAGGRAIGPTHVRLQRLFPGGHHFINILAEYPGPAPVKGDLFPMKAARARARRIQGTLARHEMVVALGRRVGVALDLRTPRYFEIVDAPWGGRAVVIPHPSGVNHWWNKPGRLEETIGILRGLGL
jgi:hypothetical protein